MQREKLILAWEELQGNFIQLPMFTLDWKFPHEKICLSISMVKLGLFTMMSKPFVCFADISLIFSSSILFGEKQLGRQTNFGQKIFWSEIFVSQKNLGQNLFLPNKNARNSMQEVVEHSSIIIPGPSSSLLV